MSEKNSKFLEIMTFESPMGNNLSLCNKFLEKIGERAVKIEVNYCPNAGLLMYTVIYWGH